MPSCRRSPLDAAFAAPETKRRYVRRLFATIADRYDFITRFLSFGRDRAWKTRLIDWRGDRGRLRACSTSRAGPATSRSKRRAAARASSGSTSRRA